MSDTPITTPTPDTPDNPQASPPATPQGNIGGNEATFTQADIDRITTRARHETRDIVQKKLLEDLGLESIDSLKSLVTDAKKRKESEMSEIEKAQTLIEAANKKAQDAITAKEALEKQILDGNRKAAFLKAAQENGGSQVEDLYILVQAKRATDFVQVFGEDATPDDAKMKALIKEVQAAFPNYFGSAGAGSPSNNNGIAPSSADFSDEAAANWERRLRKN